MLWRNSITAALSDATPDTGLKGCDVGIAACWGDYDGDLLPDLFVANATGGLSRLFRNNGNGTFQSVDLASVGISASIEGIGTWGDCDNDGDLDLFIAQGNSKPDILYQNQNDGTFVDVSVAAGISDTSSGYGPAWGDYDNDGYLDIYVPNSGTENDILYHNNGDGTFTNANATAHVVDNEDGRSAAWGDLDNDGHLDLYVTNANGEHDTIYLNQGSGSLRKMEASRMRSSYGAAWTDIENDGDLDLVVTTLDGTNFSLFRNDKDDGRNLKIKVLNSYASKITG